MAWRSKLSWREKLKKKKSKQKSHFHLKILALKHKNENKKTKTKKKKPKEENLGIRVHLKEYPVPAQKSWTGEGPEALWCILSSINTRGCTRSLNCPLYTGEQLCTQPIKFFCFSDFPSDWCQGLPVKFGICRWSGHDQSASVDCSSDF